MTLRFSVGPFAATNKCTEITAKDFLRCSPCVFIPWLALQAALIFGTGVYEPSALLDCAAGTFWRKPGWFRAIKVCHANGMGAQKRGFFECKISE
jgi:hypothetical protein